MPSEDIKEAKQVLREALAMPFGVFDGDEVAEAIRAILAHVDALEAKLAVPSSPAPVKEEVKVGMDQGALSLGDEWHAPAITPGNAEG